MAGRPRQSITSTFEGNFYFARFVHPLTKRTVCFNLGDESAAKTNLKALNEIFMNRANWKNPPDTTPDTILKQWDRDVSIGLEGSKATKAEKALRTNSAEVVRLTSERDVWKAKAEELKSIIRSLEKELEHWKGKKLHKGPLPTLEKARETWLKHYTGKDKEATKNIAYDLQRFVNHFGPKTPTDELDGKEREINAWLRGLTKKVKMGDNVVSVPISPSRRMQMRLYVLKMLEDSGLQLERKLIERPGKKEIRSKRGGKIKYLSRVQASKILAHLAEPWGDMFRVQCAIGLRPDELLTLHRNNFNEDLSSLDLAPLDHLTLKTGTRHLPVPASLRPTLKARLEKNDVLFPDPKTGKAWMNPRHFNRQFKLRLVKAAEAASVHTPMDTRIGRRTCASLLLQSNVGADRIAKLLGNTAEMVLEHYGDPDVKNIKLEATDIGGGE